MTEGNLKFPHPLFATQLWLYVLNLPQLTSAHEWGKQQLTIKKWKGMLSTRAMVFKINSLSILFYPLFLHTLFQDLNNVHDVLEIPKYVVVKYFEGKITHVRN